MSTATAFDHFTAFARPLSIRICQHAVHDWRAAKRRVAEATAEYESAECYGPGGDLLECREFERWIDTAIGLELDAERKLCGLLLMLHRRCDHPDEAMEQEADWSPVAVSLSGTIYVVGPEDEGDPRPKLTVVQSGDFDSSDFGLSEWSDR